MMQNGTPQWSTELAAGGRASVPHRRIVCGDVTIVSDIPLATPPRWAFTSDGSHAACIVFKRVTLAAWEARADTLQHECFAAITVTSVRDYQHLCDSSFICADMCAAAYRLPICTIVTFGEMTDLIFHRLLSAAECNLGDAP